MDSDNFCNCLIDTLGLQSKMPAGAAVFGSARRLWKTWICIWSYEVCPEADTQQDRPAPVFNSGLQGGRPPHRAVGAGTGGWMFGQRWRADSACALGPLQSPKGTCSGHPEILARMCKEHNSHCEKANQLYCKGNMDSWDGTGLGSSIVQVLQG